MVQKKVKKHTRQPVIIIFPYLFIAKETSFDKVVIKPYDANLIDKEEQTIKQQLFKIASFFRINGMLVQKWSYCVTYPSNKKSCDTLKSSLNKFATIIRYSQLSDPHNDARFSNFDYFIFPLSKFNLGTASNFNYYKGVLNGEYTIGFTTMKNDIKNPFSFYYNISPLTVDNLDDNKYLQNFYSNRIKEKEAKRLLKAMEWFNRSFATIYELDYADAVVHLVTAFEALFKVEDERNNKAQVKSGLIQFLGESPELTDWANKFYKLRNDIVHGDTELSPFWFTPSRGIKAHRHHLALARKIFSRCLEALLNLRASSLTSDIHEELISNEIRFKEAKKILVANAKSRLQFAFRSISEIKHDDFSMTKKQTEELGKLFLPYLLEDLRNENRQNAIAALDGILNWSGSDYSELALLYVKGSDKYDIFYFDNSVAVPNAQSQFLREAGYNFLRCAMDRLLTFSE
ncbi:MAG TPA: hypothetical protein ACFYD7_00840 [Candidatus Wujingus californicus]|uniref:hypothetical protein n=1 Tax=Candidatus Wujingus californicus TaxID=3367618 RepID=UPI001DE113EF|nr:hypothetical protein [Planctomycetota bacterium]MDO8130312.1 HEPN domain-containing protein [Candidatus Brocadiales bacterium]